MIAGCAAPQKVTGIGKPGSDVGLAARALMALNSNDSATAIPYAEQAVQKSPQDFGVRALLGNAYFATGRFASPKRPEGLAGAVLEPAAGRAQASPGANRAGQERRSDCDPEWGRQRARSRGLRALRWRSPAVRRRRCRCSRARGPCNRRRFARSPESRARLRSAGDWTNARTIAGQDVPADQLDARIHQWMQLAKPVRASDQVAALTGVTPAATDPGQPISIALRRNDSQPRQPAAAPAPAPAFAEAAPPPAAAGRRPRACAGSTT